MIKWLSRITLGITRAFSNVIDEAKIARMFGGSSNDVPVTDTSSLHHTPYITALRVIAESIGSLTKNVYSSSNGQREKDRSHPAYRLIHDEPNDMMTASVFWESFMFQLLHLGNGLALIERDGMNRPEALHLLDASHVQIVKRHRQLFYMTRDDDNQPITWRADQILHVPSPMTLDGISGVPAWRYLASALKLGISAEEFATRTFTAGTHAGSVLELDGNPPADKRAELRRTIEEFHAGLNNSHRVLLAPFGAKYKPLGINAEEAQLLELRQFQLLDVIRYLKIPPIYAGDWSRATWSNSAESDRYLAKHTLRPYLGRIEQELNRKLFTMREQVSYYTKIELDSLLRGDQNSRYSSYAVGRQWGWLSANDVRELEDMSPIDGGDIYLSPSNMQAVDMANNTVLADARRRLHTKEANAIKRKISRVDDMAEMAAWVREWYDQHADTCRNVYQPAVAMMDSQNPEQTLDDLVAKHIEESQTQILAALTADDPQAAVEAAMQKWE